MRFNVFPLIFLAATALLSIAAASASAFSVSLDYPAAGASVVEDGVKFGFTAGGQSPMACAVLANGIEVANVTAQKNLPILTRAVISAGEWMWKVNCVDSNGTSGESEVRALTVTSAAPSATPSSTPSVTPTPSPFASPSALPSASPSPSPSPVVSPAASLAVYLVVSPDASFVASPVAVGSVAATEVPALESPTPEIPKPDVAGSLSGFVVTQGGEREESSLIQSWRTNPGRRIVLSALFSNDGAKALNVSLEVLVFNETFSGLVIASVESENVLVASGEKRVLQVEWVPRSEGEFVVDAKAVGAGDADSGAGMEFDKAYLQLNVSRSANADWLFLLAFACMAIVLIAVFKTRANAKAIKGGGLN